MEIHRPPPSVPLRSPAGTTDAPIHLGQQLRATVVNTASPHTAVLQLNNRQVHVQTPVALTPGQQLELEVAQLTPTTILKLRGALISQHAASVQHAMQPLLSRQNSFALLATNLIALLNTTATKTLPQPVLESAKTLLDSLPQQRELTHPATLRAAISRSGMFLEHQLATLSGTTAQLDNDLKTLLLRLIGILSRHQTQTSTRLPTSTPLPAPPAPPLAPLPPQAHTRPPATLAHITDTQDMMSALKQQSESALARLELHQLRSLPEQDDGPPQWVLELPTRNQDKIDIFQLLIGHNHPAQHDSTTPKEWAITIAMNLESLGPMYITLRLLEKRVVTTIWSERKETTALVKRYKDELTKRLSNAGLEPLILECYDGKPPPPKTRDRHHMLDLRV